MKKLLIFGTALCIAATAFAFGGGGGGHGHKSAEYKGGLHAIGVHFGGKEVVCTEHSEKVNGLCQCVEGYEPVDGECLLNCKENEVRNDNNECACRENYVPDDDGVCVPNQCLNFTRTDCALECDPVTGEIAYATLCNNGQWYCTADHECISPCTGKEEISDCIIGWSAAGAECRAEYVANNEIVNHKVCDGQGHFVCEEEYQNESGDCIKNSCYGFDSATNPCVTSCTSSGGKADYTYADNTVSCGVGKVCNGTGGCGCIASYLSEGDACYVNACDGFVQTACITECHSSHGSATYTYAEANTSCGTGKVCDGQGNCDCIQDYLEEGEACYPNACDGFVASSCITNCSSSTDVATYTYAEANTSCGTGKICDGQGNCDCITDYLEEGDACYPNACEGFGGDICTLTCTSVGGEPSYTYASAGISCDTGKVCDGNGACVCDLEHYDDIDGICYLKCNASEVRDENHNCICDTSRKYYGNVDECQLCDGLGQVIVDNTCVCAEGWDVSGDGCIPHGRSLCSEQGLYWCRTTDICVLSEADCLNLCPEERRCGSVCCGEEHTCVDGQCQDVDGNSCPPGSAGYSTVNQSCCQEGEYLYTWGISSSWGYALTTCCPAGTWLSKAEQGAGSQYGSGSGYGERAMCCSDDSEGYAVAEDRCCEAGEKLMGWWCCPAGTTEFTLSTGCCTPDRLKKYYNDGAFPVCCDTDKKPYCAQRDLEGQCISGGCCSGNVTEGIGVNGADVCCPDYYGSDAVGYCQERSENGDCIVTSCCFSQSNISCLQEDGNGMCIFNYCCGNNEQAYCWRRDYDTGDCLQGSCCTAGYTVYWSSGSSGYGKIYGCCSGTVYEGLGTNGTDLCCSEGQEFTCIEYNDDGSCRMGACCDNNSTPYCYERDEEGKCKLAYCCSGDLFPGLNYRFGDLCCAKNQIASCVQKNNDGSCSYPRCTSCWGNQTPYCSWIRETGECGGASCCPENETLTDFDGVTSCCSEGGTGYCYQRNSEGKCTAVSCCYESQTLTEIDSTAACCNGGYTGYCSQRNANGNCMSSGCCWGSVTEGIGANGADLCCSSGYAGYCSHIDAEGNCTSGDCRRCYGANEKAFCGRYNDEGNCQSSSCCDGNIYCYSRDAEGICTEYDCCPSDYEVSCVNEDENGICRRSICCVSNSTPYCNERADGMGNCTYYSCCSGEVGDNSGTQVMDACCSGEQQITCADEDENGECLVKTCCPEGQVGYCYERDDNGNCTYPSCCNGSVTKHIGNKDVCCATGSVGYISWWQQGDYMETSCCNGTVYRRFTYADTYGQGCCVDGVPSCIIENENGECRLGACCAEGETAYCGYRRGGDYEPSCCPASKILTDFSGIHACCASDETPYCYSYESGECTSTSCCAAGQTTYCYQRDGEGNCVYTYCCNGTVIINPTTRDTCKSCSNGQTGYCTERDSNGNCTRTACCSGVVITNSKRADICQTGCSSDQTLYCVKRDSNGDCLYTGCCDAGKDVACFEEDENSICRQSSCCASGQTPYIASYDGDDYETGCCNETVFKGIAYHNADLCCPTGQTPYLGYREGEDYFEMYCCDPNKTVLDLDNLSACCNEGENLYCARREDDGTCMSLGCCSGEIFQFPGKEADKCCTDGQIGYCPRRKWWDDFCGDRGMCTSCSADTTPYCTHYGTDGFCLDTGCCTGPVSRGMGTDGTDLCCPRGQTRHCIIHDSNGECSESICCPDGEVGYCAFRWDGAECINSACGPAGCTIRCMDFEHEDADEDCLLKTCCLEDEFPYYTDVGFDWDDYHVACCAGTITEFEFPNGYDYHAQCCPDGKTAYLSWIEDSWGAVESTCYDPDAGDTLTDFGNVVLCCPAGQVGICYQHNKNGECTAASCCAGTPYCYRRDENGNCTDEDCCYSANILIKNTTVADICMWCPNGQTGYCSERDGNGQCTAASCCSGTVFEGVGYNGADACCPNGQTPYVGYRKSDGYFAMMCCLSGQTPYIYYREEDGYFEKDCCSGTVFEGVGYNGVDACCPTGQTPYIYYREEGGYFEMDCCSGTVIQNTTTADICKTDCSDGQTGYCSARDENGNCTSSSCCSGSVINNTTTTDICKTDCGAGKTGYCSQRDSEGNCIITGCCLGSVTTGVGVNGADKCCGEGYTGYCSARDENGNCTYADCCFGSVTTGVGVNGADKCCSAGKTGYCSERDSDGNCTSTSCCSGTVTKGTGSEPDICSE